MFLPLISYSPTLDNKCTLHVTEVRHNSAQYQTKMKPPLPKSTDASFKLRHKAMNVVDFQSSFFPATGIQLEGDWKCDCQRKMGNQTSKYSIFK